ncbi:condensation domain-containing protein, partial [Streptomyces sp. NPDC007856]|uniref:condensation domain-containing protein n=1 Tax=Streptomyces sp. NPDC007856 TaxID=3364781 RepID=UPI003692EEC3
MSQMPTSSSWSLSGPQMGVWFAHELDASGSLYNVGECAEIRGRVDAAVMESAVRRVIGETDVLRIRLGYGQDGPWQELVDEIGFALHVVDVSGEADPVGAGFAWMREDYATPVNLPGGELWRIALVKAGEDHFFFYTRYHHTVIDGFSMALIMRRVAELYTALVEGGPCPVSPFGPLATLLEDDAAYRAGAHFEADQHFWRDRLAHWPETVTLSTHTEANPASSGRLRTTAYLPQADVDRLQDAAHRAGVRWSALLVGAACAYLHKTTGADDLTLGLVAAARPAHLRHIPGMLSNIVPLHLTAAPGTALSELARAASREVGEVLPHQRYRREDMRRDLRMADGAGKLSGLELNLFSFDYDFRFDGHPTTVHNLSIGPVEDLMITVYMQPDGARIYFDADSVRYTQAELVAHQRRFTRVLEAFASGDSQTPLGQIDLLDESDRTRLLSEWAAGQETPTSAQATLPGLFVAQVARTPDAVAVVGEDVRLSYREV